MNPVIQLPPCAFHPFPILRVLLRLTATGHDGEKHRSNLPLRYHPPRAIENFAETGEGRVKEATTRRLGSLRRPTGAGLACTLRNYLDATRE